MSTIGIIISGVIVHDYLGEVFRGVADTAKQHGYSLITNIQNPRRHDDLTYFLEHDCDGVIVVVPYNYAEVLERCRYYKRECILIDYPREEDARAFPTIESKNAEAMQSIMDHLFQLGHRRIGYLSGTMESAAARQRFQGYQDALQAAGIAYDPGLMRDVNWSQSPSYYAARELLLLPVRPTALVCVCDVSALGAFQAARELGLEIGRDISITGFDDVGLAVSVTPALTTVRQPIYQFGQLAVEMLIKRLNGEPLSEWNVRLDAELIVRQSTGRAPT